MLEACDYHKELSRSRTIVTLGRVHNSGEKGDGALYSVRRGGEYCAHRDIRRIGVQNKSLVWLWVSQGYRLGEGSLEALEGLLGLWCPGKANALFGQCRKWFRDACKVLHKLTVIGRKSEKCAHIADTLGHWPVFNSLNFLFLGVNARG